MNLSKIYASQILDSRGQATLQVTMVDEAKNRTSFGVPSGASKGSHEASEFRDKPNEFGLANVRGCVDLINNDLASRLIGIELGNQKKFDDALESIDPSPKKTAIGGNTSIGLSGAYLKLSAVSAHIPLYSYIASTQKITASWPRLFANFVNGGKHAPGVGVQEFLLVPRETLPSKAIMTILAAYQQLEKMFVKTYGPYARLVGDEGGMAPNGATSTQILTQIHQLAAQLGNCDVSLDIAASSFNINNQYHFENNIMSEQNFADVVQGWCKSFQLLSVEDPLNEGSLAGFAALRNRIKPSLVIADDISVTNSRRITELGQKGAIDGVIIKPNQAGTMSRSFDAIRAARNLNIKVIVSHRSGETIDDMIVDFACGVGADGLKLGAPRRGERIAKYNRLLQIEENKE